MSDRSSSKESIAIIGGGMMGIISAIQLAKSDRFHVTLYEKEGYLGGLSSSYQWRDIIWDRFYHVILSTDIPLLEFIADLNLQQQIFWQETKTGFYSLDKLVPFSSTLDFIKFPFLSFPQKCRMVLGILYSSRIKNPDKLDKIYVRQWLTKVFGRRVYEQIWDPLLRSKLGNARERTSAAFIWATITRLYGARSSGQKREKMGHVHGGYFRILEAAEKRLSELGVKVVKNAPVEKLELLSGSSMHRESGRHGSDKKQITLSTSYGSSKFDKVLFTIPCQEVIRIIGNIEDDPYWRQLNQIEYLGIICVLLVLSRKLSPYYVINLLDKDLPFTGIIEATNVVSSKSFNGKHLVYLPKYMPSDDPINKLDDEQIMKLFVKNLKKVFPDLKDEEILHSQVFREKYVQPLQELGYLSRNIGIKTPRQGVYIANTSMINNSTLNNNAVVKLAIEASETILND